MRASEWGVGVRAESAPRRTGDAEGKGVEGIRNSTTAMLIHSRC